MGVSPPAAQQEMQTEPHDYGIFYRWGLDYVGELSPSAQGNKFAPFVSTTSRNGSKSFRSQTLTHAQPLA
jgi:hypothetical protein